MLSPLAARTGETRWVAALGVDECFGQLSPEHNRSRALALPARGVRVRGARRQRLGDTTRQLISPTPLSRRNEAHEAWLAALLAWTAGFIDAVGYLALGGVFVANMTGNTVVASVALAQQEWLSAWHRVFPVPLFVAGAAAGAVAIEIAHHRRWRSAHAVAFGLEAAALAAFVVAAQPYVRGGALRPAAGALFYALAALPTLAMGIQSASFRRVGSHSLRTTYVSGILTALAEEAVFAVWRRTGRIPETAASGGGAAQGSQRRNAPNRVLLSAGVWIVYGVGALLGAFLERWWGMPALALPIAVLILVAAWDLIQPDTPVRARLSEGAGSLER